MLAFPTFPQQVEVAVVQEKHRVVRRGGEAHIAADPAMYGVVQHAFAEIYPRVRAGGIGGLGQCRGHLVGVGQVGPFFGAEHPTQARVADIHVPDAHREAVGLVREWSCDHAIVLRAVTIATEEIRCERVVGAVHAPVPERQGDADVIRRCLQGAFELAQEHPVPGEKQ